MSPTILTSSGRYFDLRNPNPDDIHIGEIAHALSHLCRFTGHVRKFYSVAEHCVHTSYLVPQEHALHALLHDAAEAYIGDVASPLKYMLPEYREIERAVEAAVGRAFGLSTLPHPSVKHADLVMLATERRDLLPWDIEDQWECLLGINPIPMRLNPMSPKAARKAFIARFYQIDKWHQA
jgi:5'-deoxynucleotidase YfbR-like HD superfamily hydrolase